MFAIRLLAALLLILSVGTAGMRPQTAAAQPQAAPAAPSAYRLDAGAQETLRCTDTAALIPDTEGLTTVSVSPSGKYIAMVYRSKISRQDQHAAGIYNPMGRLPDMLYLFRGAGVSYALYRAVPLDGEDRKELSSILGAGGDLAWNEDETRCVISCKWGETGEAMTSLSRYHSNLYLLDLADGSVRRLTDNSEPLAHAVLPVWSGSAVRFLRMREEDGIRNSLCEIDPETGLEKKLADLYSAGGAAAVVYDWQAAGDRFYYIVYSPSGTTGLFVSPMGGLEIGARCLVNLTKELRETNRHPYTRNFSLLEISADSRWILLTVQDQRVLNRDFPFADSPKNPQTDPAHAVSVNGRPWVPCHNVFLYDLERGRLADPFRDPALDPAKAVVSGACFAPDGQSMLCAVFGDGTAWTLADEPRAAFYQIDLADGGFPAIRVFDAELASSLWLPEGFRWAADNTLYIPSGKTPNNPVQILKIGE